MNIVNQKFIEKLAISNSAKIVLIVLDGLGGLTSVKTGKTELETANTKNLDELAKISACCNVRLFNFKPYSNSA